MTVYKMANFVWWVQYNHSMIKGEIPVTMKQKVTLHQSESGSNLLQHSKHLIGPALTDYTMYTIR